MARALAGAALTLSLAAAAPAVAAPPYPSDSAKPDLVPLLSGYDRFWQSDGLNDLHGTVLDARTLGYNDELDVWINNHATKGQQFRALQDSEYDNNGKAYDQSLTISDGLGSVLGPLYVQGRLSGALPLTSALVNSETGTTGAYVSTNDAKAHYSHPRPYLPVDADAAPTPGDEAACAPSKINGSSRKADRVGKNYADANGNLKMQRLPDVVDDTHRFSPNDVALSGAYGTAGLCTGGSFPSGHTTTAYQAAITLATLIPAIAPEILTRASEAANNRLVVGVHYPLDLIGGRIDGEVSLATRWSDAQFRTEVLEPARNELVGYLQSQCGAPLAQCIAKQGPYQDNPYGGQHPPYGTAQIVTGRASAMRVYRERLTYGFPPIGSTTRKPSVPANAQNLLLTTYPTLNDAQRASVLAQTEIPSGYPLDGTGTLGGSWQRLELAQAMSATVRRNPKGSVTVVSTGGLPRVVRTRAKLTTVGHHRVVAGGKVRLAGSGFAPGERLELVLGHRTLLTLGAHANGRFARTVTIPRGTPTGARTIDAVDAAGASVVVRPLRIVVHARQRQHR